MNKVKCFIDMWNTEDGGELYQLCVQGKKLTHPQVRNVPECCMEGNGFFTDSDLLDEFINDNEDEIEIVEDFRCS